ncbi:transmembrane protein [Carpediemonas membranifera]|uniref:Transmembrane protein n=1 Tax=Carpediemonas membranifera TaxID=201153 RepID=A0A8J6B4B9_9EUKA|nr:transmembrane protein [Carpediemonas membranifera]|eukprot:KAG9394039.1 transmembrane protein [Carpediemonas membranifera]
MKTAVFLLLLISYVCALRVSGSIVDAEAHYLFLTRFAFGSLTEGSGHFSADISSHNIFGHNKLVVITDERWNSVWNSKTKCTDLLDPANTELQLDASSTTEVDIDVSSPHWWYVIVVDCSGGIELTYDLHFENPGTFWTREVSFEAQGLLEIDVVAIFFVVVLCGMAIGAVVFSFVYLRSIPLYIIALFVNSALYLGGLLADIGDRIIFSVTGRPFVPLGFLSDIQDILSQVIFISCLFLMVASPTLKRAKADVATIGLISVFLIVLFFTQIIVYLWSIYGMDPTSSVYAYASPAGILYLILRVIALCLFIFLALISKRTYGWKYKYIFVAVFSLWFLCHVVWVIIGVFISQFWREKLVTLAMTSTDVIYMLALVGIQLGLVKAKPAINMHNARLQAEDERELLVDEDGLRDDEEYFPL